MNRKALIVTDLQNDFMPGGALPVPQGDQVVPLANQLMRAFGLVVATQDWHPAGHGSFAASHESKMPGDIIDLNGLPQILWPVHCVQGTPGAAFHKDLNVARLDRVFHKGIDPGIDSYSGFFDNRHLKATGLGDFLKQEGVTDVYICGLATDYCVKATALDAVQLGFITRIIVDASRGVELSPGDVEKAIGEMRAAGIKVLEAKDVLNQGETDS